MVGSRDSNFWYDVASIMLIPMSIVCRKGKSTLKASKWRFSCFSKFGRILDRHFFGYEFVFWKFDYMRRKLILRPKFRVCIYLIEKSIVFFIWIFFWEKRDFSIFGGVWFVSKLRYRNFKGIFRISTKFRVDWYPICKFLKSSSQKWPFCPLLKKVI